VTSENLGASMTLIGTFKQLSDKLERDTVETLFWFGFCFLQFFFVWFFWLKSSPFPASFFRTLQLNVVCF